MAAHLPFSLCTFLSHIRALLSVYCYKLHHNFLFNQGYHMKMQSTQNQNVCPSMSRLMYTSPLTPPSSDPGSPNNSIQVIINYTNEDQIIIQKLIKCIWILSWHFVGSAETDNTSAAIQQSTSAIFSKSIDTKFECDQFIIADTFEWQQYRPSARPK